MMIKLYREMKDYGVTLSTSPANMCDGLYFEFSKRDKIFPAHVADFETLENNSETVEEILISEMHDFLHRYFGIE